MLDHAHWRSTFSLLTGDPLLEALMAALEDYGGRLTCVQGAQARLDQAAAAIDQAPEPDRDKMRHELLTLLADERQNSRQYGKAAEALVLAKLRCYAAQHGKLEDEQARLEATIAECNARLSALDTEVHGLRVTGHRAGSAVGAQLEILVGELQAKRKVIELEAEPTLRRRDQVRGLLKGLADQVSAYSIEGRKTASLTNPAGWPRAAKHRSKLLVSQNCTVS